MQQNKYEENIKTGFAKILKNKMGNRINTVERIVTDEM